MKEFKVGDKVRVLNIGESFNTYRSFFKENRLERYEKFFTYGTAIKKGEYEVVAEGKHCDGGYGTIYVLRSEDGKIYLSCNRRNSIELIKEGPKVIKACELMTETLKNPEKYEGKKYKVKFGACITYGGKDLEEVIATGGYLVGGAASRVYVSETTELEEIKPGPKPVPFMEAVKAYRAGETIRCERESKFDMTTYCSGGDLTDREHHRPINPDEILNGTWYIEE